MLYRASQSPTAAPHLNIQKHFVRVFRRAAHLAHHRINRAQRQTDLFTPSERGQEHAANSWLTPLSNPASCQSLLIRRALLPLSHWPDCGRAAALFKRRPVTLGAAAAQQARAVRVRERAREGSGLFVCRRRRKAPIIRSGVALVARVMAAVQPPPTFMCFCLGTVNRRDCVHETELHRAQLCFEAGIQSNPAPLPVF